jgi:hypothetical protein
MRTRVDKKKETCTIYRSKLQQIQGDRSYYAFVMSIKFHYHVFLRVWIFLI